MMIYASKSDSYRVVFGKNAHESFEKLISIKTDNLEIKIVGVGNNLGLYLFGF